MKTAPYNMYNINAMHGLIRTDMCNSAVTARTNVDDYIQKQATEMIPLQSHIGLSVVNSADIAQSAR